MKLKWCLNIDDSGTVWINGERHLDSRAALKCSDNFLDYKTDEIITVKIEGMQVRLIHIIDKKKEGKEMFAV